MNQPLFFEPVFQERIWGGTALKDKFGYHIPSVRTGECWAISAHPHGQSVVKSGPLKGKKIGELWNENREIFGNDPSSFFPLLVKILDANTDLSVQVHPPDQYAKSKEHTKMGKDECWYVLDCKKNAEIVLGHNAKTKEELSKEIDKGKWDSLLRKIPIKKGILYMFRAERSTHYVREHSCSKYSRTLIQLIEYTIMIGLMKKGIKGSSI